MVRVQTVRLNPTKYNNTKNIPNRPRTNMIERTCSTEPWAFRTPRPTITGVTTVSQTIAVTRSQSHSQRRWSRSLERTIHFLRPFCRDQKWAVWQAQSWTWSLNPSRLEVWTTKRSTLCIRRITRQMTIECSANTLKCCSHRLLRSRSRNWFNGSKLETSKRWVSLLNILKEGNHSGWV